MNNKNLNIMIISALLLTMGVTFHAIVPGIFFGMKPDFILAFMFIAYLLKPSLVNAMVIGLAGGYLSGLTTSFPGGFLPNVIDKFVTMLVIYLVVLLLQKVLPAMMHIKNKEVNKNVIIAPIIGTIGTLISGSVFLFAALLIVGLPAGASYEGLFYAIVIPTTVINGITTAVLYIVFKLAAVRSQMTMIHDF